MIATRDRAAAVGRPIARVATVSSAQAAPLYSRNGLTHAPRAGRPRPQRRRQPTRGRHTHGDTAGRHRQAGHAASRTGSHCASLSGSHSESHFESHSGTRSGSQGRAPRSEPRSEPHGDDGHVTRGASPSARLPSASRDPERAIRERMAIAVLTDAGSRHTVYTTRAARTRDWPIRRMALQRPALRRWPSANFDACDSSTRLSYCQQAITQRRQPSRVPAGHERSPNRATKRQRIPEARLRHRLCSSRPNAGRALARRTTQRRRHRDSDLSLSPRSLCWAFAPDESAVVRRVRPLSSRTCLSPCASTSFDTPTTRP